MREIHSNLDRAKLVEYLEQEVKRYLPRSDVGPTFSAYAESADHLLMKINAGYFDLPKAIETTESTKQSEAV